MLMLPQNDLASLNIMPNFLNAKVKVSLALRVPVDTLPEVQSTPLGISTART